MNRLTEAETAELRDRIRARQWGWKHAFRAWYLIHGGVPDIQHVNGQRVVTRDANVEWIERRGLRQPEPSYMPTRITCPVDRAHEVAAARTRLQVVSVAHPDRSETGSCTLLSLAFWRTLGWHATSLEHQTPDEAVHQRVREIAGAGGFTVYQRIQGIERQQGRDPKASDPVVTRQAGSYPPVR